MDNRRRLIFLLWVHLFLLQNTVVLFGILYTLMTDSKRRYRRPSPGRIRYSILQKIPDQSKYLAYLVERSDVTCIDNLRMDRSTFHRLCYLLEQIGGLRADKFVSVREKVAMFVTVLAHHKKMRVIGTDFKRSKDTISKCFRQTLISLLRISNLLLVDPSSIDETETNDKWRPFKGCLGRLDGTYVKVHVRLCDKIWYMSRKGEVTVNVLGVCDKHMNFVYVLTGWEGSAVDSRVLRAALTKPNGLKVPAGQYYLCDCGYMNSEGFLTPFRGVRYHLNEWRGGNQQPRNHYEYFNLKHSRARNVIENAFGLLKKRWYVLRSTTFYPIKVQNWIILACALLHNFIRREMEVDPMEHEFGDDYEHVHGVEDEYIETIEANPAWNNWRETLATNMYNSWRRR